MKAYRLFHDGMRLDDVPVPQPREGETLLEVAGAGLCHSDLHVEELAIAGKLPWPVPFTLGHEITGWADGKPYAVYCAWGCGSCEACLRGSNNYCGNFAMMRGPGLGVDGGMAQYVVVPERRFLVPLGDLDPVDAAPLADAGVTSFHAVRRSLPLLGEGSSALVLGVGGLGHLAIQILKAISPARIVAVDAAKSKVDLARSLGASEALLASDDLRERLRGRFDAVFDFVGSQATMDLARRAVRADGDVALVGLAGGTLGVRQGSIAYGARVSMTFYGTLDDLHRTIELARAGKIRAHVSRYPLDRADEAVEALREGALEGRAVLTPAG